MIAIRKSALDGMSAADRSALGRAVPRLLLGIPAVYTDGVALWYVLDDPRLRDGSEWQAAMPKPVEANSKILNDGFPPLWKEAPDTASPADPICKSPPSAGAV